MMNCDVVCVVSFLNVLLEMIWIFCVGCLLTWVSVILIYVSCRGVRLCLLGL